MLWFRYNRGSQGDMSKGEEEQQAQILIGNMVGEVAQAYFDDGKTVVIDTSAGFSPENYDDYARQTADAMADPEVTCIAEAAFYTGDLIVFIDLFHRNDDGSWDIYEVKSSGLAKPVHAQDCAWQTYVVRTLCGVDVRNSYIMIPSAGWSIISETNSPCTYYALEAPEFEDTNAVDYAVNAVVYEDMEEAVADALSSRFSTRKHTYGEWADKIEDFDNVKMAFYYSFSEGYSVAESAEYAADLVEREDHLLAVDDYTDWIYEQSVGEEIPARIEEFFDMLVQPEPPECPCANPGTGFMCLQPYECHYTGICSEYLDQGK